MLTVNDSRLKWFKAKHATSSPGTWKICCAYDTRQYLLDVATEKADEKDELETELQGQACKDAVVDERGLSYASCLKRFELQMALADLLSQTSRPAFSWENEITDEFLSPIIYADKFISPNDEELLVEW